MRRGLSRFAIPLSLFALGIVLLAASVLEGKGEVHWVLFIPVFTGTSIFAFVGTVLIIVSVFLFIYVFMRDFTVPYDGDAGDGGRVKGAPQSARNSSLGGRAPGSPEGGRATGSPGAGQGQGKRFGGMVLVGPIPIIFGSDPRMTRLVVILAIILVIVAVLFMAFYMFMWRP